VECVTMRHPRSARASIILFLHNNNIIVHTKPIKMVAISCARMNASVARAQCAPRAAPAFRAAPLRPSRMVRVHLM
jgi:hypothetical protein